MHRIAQTAQRFAAAGRDRQPDDALLLVCFFKQSSGDFLSDVLYFR